MLEVIVLALVPFVTALFINDALGGGYGTITGPTLLLLGHHPQDFIPAILFSEAVSEYWSGAWHLKFHNVNVRTFLLTTFGGAIGILTAVVLIGVTLVLVIGLVQIGPQAMADRYIYILLIGVFVTIARGIPELTSLLVKPSAVPALAVGAGIVVFALSACTWRQVSYWKDSISLWNHSIRVTEQNGRVACNYFAHNDLGLALVKQPKVDEAAVEFSEVLRISPTFAEAHRNPAVARYCQIDCGDAWDHVHLARKYGVQGHPGFLRSLAEKMPEPPR